MLRLTSSCNCLKGWGDNEGVMTRWPAVMPPLAAESCTYIETAPPEGCTHIDEALSAAPPDVEGSTLQADVVLLLDGACPPQVETWTRLALEPY